MANSDIFIGNQRLESRTRFFTEAERNLLASALQNQMFRLNQRGLNTPQNGFLLPSSPITGLAGTNGFSQQPAGNHLGWPSGWGSGVLNTNIFFGGAEVRSITNLDSIIIPNRPSGQSATTWGGTLGNFGTNIVPSPQWWIDNGRPNGIEGGRFIGLRNNTISSQLNPPLAFNHPVPGIQFRLVRNAGGNPFIEFRFLQAHNWSPSGWSFGSGRTLFILDMVGGGGS